MTFEVILFYVFLIVCLIQLGIYALIFLPFSISKPKQPSLKKIGVSVLVCAKNEAENLKRLIPEILKQDFPEFELVLINDDSKDNSLEIMREFAQRHSNIKVVDVKPIDSFWNNKKYPLTLGIKAATHDFLLFTDADCIPLSDQWIKSMSRRFSNEKGIVLGYGAYKKIKGSLINLIIRFETVLTAMQYFSMAKIGRPYMGVGRNLAYRRDLFYEAGGFKDHMHVLSGDDDLFVNQVATKENTALCLDPEGFTESLPKTGFQSWFRQKMRHISASPHYKIADKFSLGIFNLSLLLFWALTIILLITGFNFTLILALAFIRIVLAILIYGLCAKRFNESDTAWLFPLLELFLIIFHLVIFISSLTSKKQHWR
ncbi:MAG: glycosyltransferase [Bacteroidia bacterium]|nr:glycosyltransferase [Bacteroidia bacterium]MBT8268106.1 glycosyltransferase [Bacteroidia bacterium]NNF82711.1 glycosyltransferase [Flavobacteriaceae bacterium]NNK71323.1 glycosyltransferase [Flavobacteriaceae bacterium]NNL79277.1 glycosyltransferase [Flavobacteriaceae bacterium]